MHPKDPRGALLYDVHFVVGAVVRLVVPCRNAVAHASLLAICGNVDVLATFGEFVLVARVQALIEMVILWVATQV